MKREGKKREIGFNKGYVFFFFFFFYIFYLWYTRGCNALVVACRLFHSVSFSGVVYILYRFLERGTRRIRVEYDFRIEYYTLVVRERERKRVRFLSSANISIHGRNEQLYKSNVFFSSYRLRINVYNNEFICACFVVDSIFLNLLRD